MMGSIQNGFVLIAKERLSHPGKGWTTEHDDSHSDGELAVVAARLAVSGTYAWVENANIEWSVDLEVKTDGDRIRQLSIAGSLIAAEIDRLLRVKSKTGPQTPMTEEQLLATITDQI